MKDFKLTKNDLDRIKNSYEANPVNRYLKAKNRFGFKVGDVLIRKRKSGYGDTSTWKVETISDRSPVPKKFIYVHENDLGVGYIKQIKSNGKELCDNIQCLDDLDFTWTTYEVDPDYIDHIVLTDGDQDFTVGDQFVELRKKRNKIHNLNRKIAHRPSTEVEMFNFLSSLSVGQKIWFGSDLYEASYKEMTISKIETGTPKEIYGWSNTRSTLTTAIRIEGTEVNTKTGNGPYGRTITSEAHYYVFYTTQPHAYEQPPV